MFDSFQQQWTPILHSPELAAAPVRVRVAGEALVVFRGADGAATALLDRCPHRGVALSLGKVVNGCLECPFHGWRFAPDGARAHVPYNALDPAQLRATRVGALPTVERGGLVWVYTEVDAAEPGAPHIPEELVDPKLARFTHAEVWQAHWTRAMENMLDTPHLPFVHGASIGRGMRVGLGPDARMEQEIEDNAAGFRLRWTVNGASDGASLDWFRPNGMRLNLDFGGGRHARPMVWCVPVGPRETRMMMVAVRDFGVGNPLLALGDRFNVRILAEDRAVVESSDPAEVPDPREEAHVPTDRPTLAFRRWYRATQRDATRPGPLGIAPGA